MADSNTHSTDDTTTDSATETLGGTSGDSAVKDPEQWVTGDEPMTGAQRSYLDTLAREAGEELPADLTKAEASEHIERPRAPRPPATGSPDLTGSERPEDEPLAGQVEGEPVAVEELRADQAVVDDLLEHDPG
jgi:hypothetical protein